MPCYDDKQLNGYLLERLKSRCSGIEVLTQD